MAIKTIDKNGKKIYEVYVNGFNSSGRRVQMKRRGIESLRKAQSAEFELKRELAKIRDEKVSYRWSEWLDECLRRMKLIHQPSTIINYDKSLNKWATPDWKDLELNKISKNDVYNLIFEGLDSKLSMQTRRTIFKMIKRVFQMAIEDGSLTHNPCLGIVLKVPEVDQKVLTSKEVEILLKEARLTNHRFYPIWVIALMTGMRSGELFALKWTDIELEARMISVSRQWTNKSGFTASKTRRSRIVPISDELLSFLRDWKLKADFDEFVLPHLREWQNGEQAQVLRDFCKSIGITSVKFHDLRATFITNLLSRGESLARVMAIVGHTQIKTTNVYLRKAGIDVMGATEKLGYNLPKEGDALILSFTQRS
jgi:integrase